MTALDFAITGARADATALAPTLRVGLRVTAPGAQIQSILLRCQIRIEPERRGYDDDEQRRLLDLFGEPRRWSSTLQPFLLTHVTAPLGGFADATEVDLPVEVSYDLETTAGKYLHAVRDGTIPLVFLFSGTVFHRGPNGVHIEQIPWDREARYGLPVAVWTAVIDAHHPGTGWLRLDRGTIDALQAYKTRHALPTWDSAVAHLLEDASVVAPGPPDGLT